MCRCVMCHSHHMTKQTSSSFDGRQAHWAALASFIPSIAGDFLRVSDANDLSQLTFVKSIKSSPFMLYLETGTIKALYSLSPSEMWRFLAQRDHCLWKATAASCFLRATSSTSPSNEPSLRGFCHCSTSRVFLL